MKNTSYSFSRALRRLRSGSWIFHAVSTLVLVLVQLSLYIFITQPSLDAFFSASVLSKGSAVTHEQGASHESNDESIHQFQEEIEAFRQHVRQLEEQISQQSALSPEPQIVIKREVVEVEKPIYIPSPSPASSDSTAISEPESMRLPMNKNGGSVLVDDGACSSGKAWQDVRLERECAQ